LAGRQSPLVSLFRVNAGALPAQHWANGAEGGGRLRGEACHMLDFFQAIVGAPLESISVSAIKPTASSVGQPDENFSAQFSYADGSLCTLVYTSLGHAGVSKEYVETHWMGKSAVIDDFKKLTFHGGVGKNISSGQDKGHRAALDAFFKSIQQGISFPTPWADLLETSRAVIELDREVWGKSAETCAGS
jgi:predicted dehydrogenase